LITVTKLFWWDMCVNIFFLSWNFLEFAYILIHWWKEISWKKCIVSRSPISTLTVDQIDFGRSNFLCTVYCYLFDRASSLFRCSLLLEHPFSSVTMCDPSTDQFGILSRSLNIQIKLLYTEEVKEREKSTEIEFKRHLMSSWTVGHTQLSPLRRQCFLHVQLNFFDNSASIMIRSCLKTNQKPSLKFKKGNEKHCFSITNETIS